MKSELWRRDELIAVLKLYCVTPFGKIYARNPSVVAVAQEIGRTANAVALKMTNFASLDPTLKQRGMVNHSRLDKTVWDEFFANMDAFFETTEAAAVEPIGLQEAAQVFRDRPGIDVLALRKTRVNQNFFRSLILASYDNKCALTGIDSPDLLVASHIVPWSVDEKMRTNPTNGICLNALHDKAFDLGFMTFDTDLTVLYSPQLPTVARNALAEFGGTKLKLPSRFIPDAAMLAHHRSNIFVAG